MTLSTAPPTIYPESDGKPRLDNTVQWSYITTIVNSMDALFAQDQDVFVAGDRGFHKQWEEGNIPPQVVFEIASPCNTKIELEEKKQQFYQRYGVEEYYLFYPDKGVLRGWLRSQETLETISDMSGWISPPSGSAL